MEEKAEVDDVTWLLEKDFERTVVGGRNSTEGMDKEDGRGPFSKSAAPEELCCDKILVRFFNPVMAGVGGCKVNAGIEVSGRILFSSSSPEELEEDASSSPSPSSSSSSSFESLRTLDCVRMDEQDRSFCNRRMLGFD